MKERETPSMSTSTIQEVTVSNAMRALVMDFMQASMSVGAAPHRDSRCDASDRKLNILLRAIGLREQALVEARNLVATAIGHDDGLDAYDGEPFITSVGDLLGDSDDYRASQKCSDDPCERCGRDSIRNVIKHGYANYEGICNTCFAFPSRTTGGNNG